MLIERALRERTSAIQSGPSDIGLFGATPQTFASQSNVTSGAFNIGPVMGGAQAGIISSIGDTSVAPAPPFDTTVMTSGALATPLGVVTAEMQAGTIIAQPASFASDAPASAPADVAITGGSFFVAPQASVQLGVQSGASEQVQTLSIAGEAAGAAVPVAASLSDITGAGAVTAKLSEIEASIAQARADALDPIEQIAATATTQVAEIQAKLAETIANVGSEVAGLTATVGEQVDDIAAPVLDLVADMLGTIGTAIAADVDAGLDMAIQLGDTQIGLGQQIAITADLAIDAELPLDGADVAGGVATLIDMVTEDAGYMIEDVTAGVAWPLASSAPLDSVEALIDVPADLLGIDPFDDVAHADAGGALLGLGNAADPLHGLFDTDDFGLGLG